MLLLYVFVQILEWDMALRIYIFQLFCVIVAEIKTLKYEITYLS